MKDEIAALVIALVFSAVVFSVFFYLITSTT